MATKRKAAKKSKPARKRSASPRGGGAARGVDRDQPALQRQGAGRRRGERAPGSVRERQGLAGHARRPAQQGRAREGAAGGIAGAAGGELQRRRFESCRGDYIATLRKVADDPDPELRQRVLGLLAREKDGFAQKKLLEGLQDPDKALVPPEKALQLLSYDVHADAYAAARDIVKKPPNEMARREALRLLAADATAAPMFEKLMRDKNELREIRQISASALHRAQAERDCRSTPARSCSTSRTTTTSRPPA